MSAGHHYNIIPGIQIACQLHMDTEVYQLLEGHFLERLEEGALLSGSESPVTVRVSHDQVESHHVLVQLAIALSS